MNARSFLICLLSLSILAVAAAAFPDEAPGVLTARVALSGPALAGKTVNYKVLSFTGRTLAEGRATADARAGFMCPVPLPADPTQKNDFLAELLLARVDYSADGVKGRAAMKDALPVFSIQFPQIKEIQAGTRTRLRFLAVRPGTGAPLPGVRIELKGLPAGLIADRTEGFTGAEGAAVFSLAVPESLSGRQALTVSASREGWSVEEAFSFDAVRSYQALLQTDKPIYQPGQTMHIRALVFKAFQKRPVADRRITLQVSDPRDNKVFRSESKANPYGIVSADFSLADEVLMGTYRIALLGADGASIEEKTVEVSRYVLPKFKVTLTPDQPYYKPGAQARLTIQAAYFFGKPVSGGVAHVTASRFTAGLESFGEHEVRLDARGQGELRLTLPAAFYGTPFDQGKAFVLFQARVEDTAGQEVQASANTPVVPDPLFIHLIPEAGGLAYKTGIPNRLYFVVSDPLGNPVETPLQIRLEQNGKTLESVVKSGPYGIAAYELPAVASGACVLKLKAQAPDGTSVEKTFTLNPEGTGEAVVIRSERARVKVGEEIRALVMASKSDGMVYWDILKDKQVLLTGMGRLREGRRTFAITASSDMVGTLLLRAYTFDRLGNVLHHETPLLVAPAADLNVRASFDKSEYRPGSTATAYVELTDANGRPKQGALGVVIVDEAVFALARLQPGLEKIYFLLEDEIMKPRFEIHGLDARETALESFEGDQKRGQSEEALKAVLQLAQATGAPAFSSSFEKQMPALQSLADQKLYSYAMTVGQKIQRALESYRRLEGSCPPAERAMRELLRKKLITGEESKDPWGNLWILTPYYTNSICDGNFILKSKGPDGKADSGDERAYYIYNYGRGKDKGVMAQNKAARQDMAFDAVGGMAEGGASMGLALPASAPAEKQALMKEEESKTRDDKSGAPEPRVRKFFPETMFFLPFIETGADGKASLSIPVADSITTWRASWIASTRDGLLGSATVPLKVFQEFFVDLDLPLFLTKGDEVSLPVVVYNYTTRQKEIRLVLAETDGLTPLAEKGKTVTLDPSQVLRFTFPVKADRVGMARILLKASTDTLSDAIEKTIPVIPDGKEMKTTASGVLNQTITLPAGLPAHALDEGARVQVLIYPSYFSQAIDGLDKIFRMPGGCFEQTSSTTYPNILALAYMEKSHKANPELTMKAEGFINQGYQRLLTFEVPGGGFSWFGNPPANKILTAYGLMEFKDMSMVHAVDARIIDRTAAYLESQQQGDGSWSADKEYIAEGAVNRFLADPVRITAYIAWALVNSGHTGPATDRALNYIEPRLDKVEDVYTMALLANLYADLKNPTLANRMASKLAGKAVKDGKKVHWKEEGATSFYSTGGAGDVETTGLIAMAFMKSKIQPELTQGALDYLISSKDSWGTWYSTQATVNALKALVFALENGSRPFSGNVRIYLDDALQKTLAISKKESDLTFSWSTASGLTSGSKVRLEFDGDGSPLYQVVTTAYIPWAFAPKEDSTVTIGVDYDKSRLAADDTLTATARIKNNTDAALKMLILDLGVPPGFTVLTDNLEKAKQNGTLQKFQLTGRQIILYLDELKGGQALTFTYGLQAKYPVKAAGTEAKAYEYYNPQNETRIQQGGLVVSE